ncbi:hypothetical protein [Spiroplasma endosymbiont of Ammophila pubescens]|uniref:hypothetical protein n=1 Tax=Spiroplasma endosymbiont of Ammophila pubescens TaxID=3066315 RepID=UPI0032B2081E
MKKILSILTISTAILNGISTITAIKPNNNEILTNFINTETEYAKLIKINTETVQFIAFDDKGNSFIGTKNELYYLQYKNTKKQKINVINELVKTITFHKNITYIGTEKGAYILKNRETTAIKINNFIFFTNHELKIDNNKIYVYSYIGNYNIKIGETTATKINVLDYVSIHLLEIDKNHNVYFATNQGLYVLKNGETTTTKINGIDENVWTI